VLVLEEVELDELEVELDVELEVLELVLEDVEDDVVAPGGAHSITTSSIA
jgi:hypothetical protein